MKIRIINSILSVLIILSVIVTPTRATNIDNNASTNELYKNQEYIVQSNSDLYSDENYDCIPFEEIIVEIPIISSTNESASTYAGSSAEVFVLRGGLHSYSNGTFTWFFNVDCITSYQVHHIQPLAYGGNNSYDNLIHLPIDIHTSITRVV